MLKQLRFDGYKLLHSRVLWGVYIFSFVAMILSGLGVFVHPTSVFSAIFQGVAGGIPALLSVAAFVAFFVGADYRTGYIKTVGSKVNWAKYVLSKALYIFVFCFVFVFVLHLLLLIGVPIAGGALAIKGTSDEQIGLAYYYLFMNVIGQFAYGMLIMFVLFSTKSTTAALVFGVAYYFLATILIYPSINTTLTKWLHLKEESAFRIERFTAAGIGNIMQYDFINGNHISLKTSVYLGYHFTYLCYTMLSIGFSILICYLRKRKN